MTDSPSRPTSACLFSTLRLNLVLTHGVPPAFRGAIRHRVSPEFLSGHPMKSMKYRWRSPPRVRQQIAVVLKVVPVTGLPLQFTMDQFMCLCVCMCCHPIYSGRQTCGRTSRGYTGGRSHRISPSFFCGACLNFHREKNPAVPFPRRPCSRILCTTVLTN